MPDRADLTAIAPSLQTTIYRVTQESLNNVRKHSGSGRATVSLRQIDGNLRFQIEERGPGFDFDSARQRASGSSA